jgi:YHS domain-containing protein
LPFVGEEQDDDAAPEGNALEVAHMKLRARFSRVPFAMGLSTDVDPVCKKAILSRRIASEHDGEAYYFCSPACKTTFDADPAKYLS